MLISLIPLILLFPDTNKDVVPDDLVAVFHKHSCNFGFATHLFGSELKALYSAETVPRGVSFRISPTSHTDLWVTLIYRTHTQKSWLMVFSCL